MLSSSARRLLPKRIISSHYFFAQAHLANYLKDVGIQKGDAILIYLPMIMELPIAMLACARIWAVHSVVFAGFFSESLAQRIIDCKPKIVITCHDVRRGSKTIYLEGIVDAAVTESTSNGTVVEDLIFLLYTRGSTGKSKGPSFPDPGRCWDIVDKYKVSISYIGPTLIRSLMREWNESAFRRMDDDLHSKCRINTQDL